MEVAASVHCPVCKQELAFIHHGKKSELEDAKRRLLEVHPCPGKAG